MRRDTFDEDVPLPPHGKAPQMQAKRHQCRYCGGEATYETLATYGARCYHCYAAYCREQRTFAEVGRKTHPLSWADSLRRRHANGYRLTPAQIAAYSDVLRQPQHQPIESAYD